MRKTPSQTLNARLEAGRSVVTALQISAKQLKDYDRRECEALAMRISRCNAKSNAWLQPDAYSLETGECYDAAGTFWNCNSKLCPNCLAKQSARSRKKLREALQQQKLIIGERLYFATFTIKNPGLSLSRTRELVYRAWSLFRKRKLCVDLVRGGAKTEEFTVTKGGFHYHLHTILLSRYLHFNEIRRLWTECVQTAFDEAGLELQINTSDGMLLVNVQHVKSREQTINEVCKYITKSDSWAKMPPAALAEISLVRRWCRMFELFGSFAPRETGLGKANSNDAAETPILDTRCLTDGEADAIRPYWRDQVALYGLEWYEAYLDREIEAAKRFRTEQISLRWQGLELLEGEQALDV